MSGKAFLGIYSMDREKNKLGCDHKHLRDNMPSDTIEYLKAQRNLWREHWIIAKCAIKDVSNNNRIKNKKVNHESMAKVAICYFNFRSFDFYLYRLGFTPICGDMYDVGIEYQMVELATYTESLLHMLGEYHGYNSIHWTHGNGCKLWAKDGEPDFPEKEKYIREDLGIFYYTT